MQRVLGRLVQVFGGLQVSAPWIWIWRWRWPRRVLRTSYGADTFTATCTLPLHRACAGNSQAKAMLALTVIAFIVVVVALFARSWTFGAHGPGIGTKVKILLTHFQASVKSGTQQGLPLQPLRPAGWVCSCCDTALPMGLRAFTQLPVGPARADAVAIQ